MRLIVVLILVTLGIWIQQRTKLPSEPESLAPGTYTVERAVDGDTLLLANAARVRLLGVDTPETVKPDHPVEPWGEEASDRTKSLVNGRKVRLELDKERQDPYGRFLAYVWFVDPETGEEKLLNDVLIREGLGRAALGFRYSETMKRRFRDAEAEAKSNRRGIWSSDAKSAA